MQLRWICVLLFGLSFRFGTPTDEDEDVGNANDYIDKVLDNLRKEHKISKHIDPLSVPGVSDHNYNVKNIKVNGLSNLYRYGDCTLTYNDDVVNVVTEIAVGDVKVTLDYSAKALFFWVHGDGVVSLDHLAVKLDLSSTDGNAQVNSLKVTKFGNFHIQKVTGLSFALNWLLKIIANNVAQNARGNIIYALENGAKDALNNLLKEYKLPI